MQVSQSSCISVHIGFIKEERVDQIIHSKASDLAVSGGEEKGIMKLGTTNFRGYSNEACMQVAQSSCI